MNINFFTPGNTNAKNPDHSIQMREAAIPRKDEMVILPPSAPQPARGMKAWTVREIIYIYANSNEISVSVLLED